MRVRPRGPPTAEGPAARRPGGLRPLATPFRAWGAPAGPTVLYWLLTGLLAVAALRVVGLGWRIHRSAQGQTSRRRDRPHHQLEGVASRGSCRRPRREAEAARRGQTSPPLDHQTETGGGRPAPRDQPRCRVLDRGRDSTVIVGPPGAGKGLHVVIPAILDWNGPVVTTSTRPDNLAVTMAARARRGPVAVFDPQRLAPGIASAARWSPTRGCEDPQTAMARAAGLVADAAAGRRERILLGPAGHPGRPVPPARGRPGRTSHPPICTAGASPPNLPTPPSGYCGSTAATPGRTRWPRSWGTNPGSGTRCGRCA